jgi:type IV pilus assembly protein PilM
LGGKKKKPGKKNSPEPAQEAAAEQHEVPETMPEAVAPEQHEVPETMPVAVTPDPQVDPEPMPEALVLVPEPHVIAEATPQAAAPDELVSSFEPEPDEVEPQAEPDVDDFNESIAALRDAATPETGKKKKKRPPIWKRELKVSRDKKERGGRKLVGLKIGASQIAAAHVRNDGPPEVLRVARTPLDRGVVVSGELRDPDALAAALRVFFKENQLPKRDVRLGIASNRVGVRVLEVAGVDDPKLLGNAVRFRAQEILPIPLSEAVLDYRVLRERTDETGAVVREVLVAFAYRELVDRYAAVCRRAGLKLIGIDLDGFAMLRALVDPAGERAHLDGAAVVTVSLGHDRSIMSVSDGTTCEFTRVVEWGGASLDAAVARILALTPSQAEPIKRQLTLDRNAPTPDGLSPEQAGRARAAMVQEVHAFVREFVSSLQFYQAQPGSLDIGEIVITGGTAHMPGLADQLRELIGVAVRVGDPLGRVLVGKKVATEEPVGSLALAIGLGIED